MCGRTGRGSSSAVGKGGGEGGNGGRERGAGSGPKCSSQAVSLRSCGWPRSQRVSPVRDKGAPCVSSAHNASKVARVSSAPCAATNLAATSGRLFSPRALRVLVSSRLARLTAGGGSAPNRGWASPRKSERGGIFLRLMSDRLSKSSIVNRKSQIETAIPPHTRAGASAAFVGSQDQWQ